MRAIVGWFQHNAWYKLAAFLVALVAWVVVSAQTNPLTQATIAVPVEVRKPEGLAVTAVSKTEAEVSFCARRDVLTRLQQRPTPLVLLADASDLGPGARHPVPTRVALRFGAEGGGTQALPGYIIPDSNLPDVVVDLESVRTKTVPVAPGWRGTTPAGLRVDGFSFEPAQVAVSGAASLVERVETAVAPVDVSNVSLQPGPSVVVPVEPRDASKQPVPGVEASPENVKATPIVVAVAEKRVTVTVQYGEPRPGYEVVSVSAQPSVVRIAGRSGALRDVQRVSTELLDLSRATGTFTTTASLRAPEGVSSMSPDKVTVTVTIGRRPPPEAPPETPEGRDEGGGGAGPSGPAGSRDPAEPTGESGGRTNDASGS